MTSVSVTTDESANVTFDVITLLLHVLQVKQQLNVIQLRTLLLLLILQMELLILQQQLHDIYLLSFTFSNVINNNTTCICSATEDVSNNPNSNGIGI